MKTYDQLLPKFSNEPGLQYRDMYVYPNNSIYRGQMKQKDESNRMKIQASEHSSHMSTHQNGINEDDNENLNEFRHGYGIQYWTDGAHYEG